MRFSYLLIAVYVFLSFGVTHAQTIGKTKFSGFLSQMPLPQPGLEETVRVMGGDPDQIMETQLRTLRNESNAILQPFFLRFKSNIDETKNNKAALMVYSTEEQSLMKSFEKGTIGLNEEGQFSGFVVLMENRPSAGSGKLAWDRLNSPVSTTAKSYYQQVLQIERKLNWTEFMKGVSERDMMRNAFATDQEIIELNKQIEEEQAKIPQRKVKTEGFDYIMESPDPEQMIKLLQTDNERRQRYIFSKYKESYTWWKANEVTLRDCAMRMDELIEAIDFGNNLGGSDRQIIPIIADVQQRIWEALYNLNCVTRSIVIEAQEAIYFQKHTEESVEMYKRMKVVD